ncbi:MAG: acyltransferase family protein, partial [Ferruginibacter sp.]
MQPEIKIQQGGHIPQLDGLRGIAILMVICYHYFPGNIVCNFGWTGVDLFFVLSGFLITGRLLPYLNENKILVRFYRNRFLRIVPLYFTFLMLFFAGWFLLSSNQTLSSFGFYKAHWWQFFLFIQNWVFAGNIAESKTHVQHLWSVAVEEQIYLFFPLFLILIRNKKQILYAVIFIIIVIIISRWYYLHFILQEKAYLKIYLNTFFRLDSFLCGVLVYIMYNDRNIYRRFLRFIPWLTMLCALVLFLYIAINRDAEKSNAFISGGGYTIIALMFAGLLMIILLKKNKMINRITSLSFLRFTGRIS